MNTELSTNSKGTALITGASSGIGAVYADRLAKRGYDLIIVARDQVRLKELAERLGSETGRTVEVLAADLNNREDLAAVEQRLRTDTGIVMLVNNAGVSVDTDFADADPDALENMIRLNAIVPTRLAVAVIPGFIERGSGTLINISSVLALAPEMFNGTYSGTKAFLLNLSLRLQNEVGPKGIRVQAVLPGATRTAIWEKAGTDIESLPPGILMEVDEMVDAALNGLDRGENITIPSLPDMTDWEAFETARKKLIPNLSRSTPAARYKTKSA